MPVTKVRHKRRTEDEMRKALKDYADGKPLLIDDEREEILSDAITEVIALRAIQAEVTQTLASINMKVAQDTKKILAP